MPWRPVADSAERGRMRHKLSQSPAGIRLADPSHRGRRAPGKGGPPVSVEAISWRSTSRRYRATAAASGIPRGSRCWLDSPTTRRPTGRTCSPACRGWSATPTCPPQPRHPGRGDQRHHCPDGRRAGVVYPRLGGLGPSCCAEPSSGRVLAPLKLRRQTTSLPLDPVSSSTLRRSGCE
jgi:hypothetical protein